MSTASVAPSARTPQVSEMLAEHPRSRLVEALNNPVRFSIVAALAPVDRLAFRDLRDALGLTDSALSKQISALEEAGLVTVNKSFIAKKPITHLSLPAEGLAAWEQHLAALREIAAGLPTPAAGE